MRFEMSNCFLDFIGCTVNLRSRILHTPYGDQAIFVKSDVFREIRGFPDIPIMEDVEIIKCMRRQGKIAIIPAPVITSARRWRAQGMLKTTLLNKALIMANSLGISPERIARWNLRNRKN